MPTVDIPPVLNLEKCKRKAEKMRKMWKGKKLNCLWKRLLCLGLSLIGFRLVDYFSEKIIAGPHGVPDPPSLAQMTFTQCSSMSELKLEFLPFFCIFPAFFCSCTPPHAIFGWIGIFPHTSDIQGCVEKYKFTQILHRSWLTLVTS